MQKTSQFKAQCKGDIDVPLQDELLCLSFVLYVKCVQLIPIHATLQVLKVGWFSVG